jgi:hypothetical protein
MAQERNQAAALRRFVAKTRKAEAKNGAIAKAAKRGGLRAEANRRGQKRFAYEQL